MENLLLVVLIVLVGIFLIKFFRNNSKNKQMYGGELSTAEKIFKTLDSRIKTSLNNLAGNLRTLDVVRKEIIYAFDEAKKDLKESSADYIISLKNTQTNIINNKVIYESNIAKCTNKARDYKKVYEDSKDENYLILAKEFIANKLAYEEGLVESDKMLNEVQKDLELFEMRLYRISMVLDRKKLEILGNITKPVHNLKLNLNVIDTLYKEFNTIKDTVETKQKVEEIVEGEQFDDVTMNTNYTVEEIDEELAKL